MAAIYFELQKKTVRRTVRPRAEYQLERRVSSGSSAEKTPAAVGSCKSSLDQRRVELAMAENEKKNWTTYRSPMRKETESLVVAKIQT